MKKLLLISGFAFGLMASAQIPGKPATKPVTQKADAQAVRLNSAFGQSNPKAALTGPSWFQTSEAVKAFQGGTDANYSYMTIFPDTNAYISYSATGGGASVTNNIINSAGLVFDPRGAVWADGPFQTSRWNAYTVDSIAFTFFYKRFNSNAAAVDTLYVTTFDKTSISRGFSSIYAGAVDYTRNKYTAKGTNANTQKVLLTPADTIGGSRVIQLPVLGTKTVAGANTGANYFGCVVSFAPAYKGYQHGAPWDTVGYYNSGAKYNATKVCNIFRLLSYFDPAQYVEDAVVPAINGQRIYNHGVQAQQYARYGMQGVDYFYPAFYSASNGFPAISFLVSTNTLDLHKITGTALGAAYPNPGTSGTTLHVPFKTSINGNVEVRLSNVNGQVVRTANKSCNAGVNEVTFDLADLSAGIYTYTLTTADFSGSGKVMVK
jgi:hypothetical protein